MTHSKRLSGHVSCLTKVHPPATGPGDGAADAGADGDAEAAGAVGEGDGAGDAVGSGVAAGDGLGDADGGAVAGATRAAGAIVQVGGAVEVQAARSSAQAPPATAATSRARARSIAGRRNGVAAPGRNGMRRWRPPSGRAARTCPR